LQQVYGAKKIRGCTIIDAPPFFESAGREGSVDPTSRENRRVQKRPSLTRMTDSSGGSNPREMTREGEARRTSENVSRGGSTRRKGWYRTNDIQKMACGQDMEICVPKSGKSYSPESIEEIWEA
jgi:hypothetical protein